MQGWRTGTLAPASPKAAPQGPPWIDVRKRNGRKNTAKIGGSSANIIRSPNPVTVVSATEKVYARLFTGRKEFLLNLIKPSPWGPQPGTRAANPALPRLHG